jgi:hypothetical protein
VAASEWAVVFGGRLARTGVVTAVAGAAVTAVVSLMMGEMAAVMRVEKTRI